MIGPGWAAVCFVPLSGTGCFVPLSGTQHLRHHHIPSLRQQMSPDPTEATGNDSDEDALSHSMGQSIATPGPIIVGAPDCHGWLCARIPNLASEWVVS